MAEFRYEAIDRNGKSVSGELEAASEHGVAAQLEQRGMRIVKVTPLAGKTEAKPPADEVAAQPSAPRLSSGELQEVVGQVATLAALQLPLSSGLRALSGELPAGRLRRTLTRMSERLDAGETIEAVLQNVGRSVPRHLRGVIEAGVRNNNLGLMLEEYLRYTRTSVDLRRQVFVSLGYPIILIAAAVAVCAAFLGLVIPEFQDIFEDFGTELPAITLLAIELAEIFNAYGLGLIAFFVFVVVFAWLIVTIMGGRAYTRRALNSVPVIGSMFRYTSFARFCHLLALLIKGRALLPDAVRMAGSGAGDAELYDGSLKLAENVEQGMTLVESADTLKAFPVELKQLFRWEKRDDAFPEILHAAGEVFESRTRIQSGLVGLIFEPVVLVGVSIVVGGSVLAMFMPLIKLLNDLS